jgi:hypothetical protein
MPSSLRLWTGGRRSRTFRRAPFLESRSDVAFDYDQHKRGGLGSGASEPERLRVDATRPRFQWHLVSGMETITTGHFQ